MRRRSGFGWLELITGLLAIVLGILVFAVPNLIMTGMVYAFGIAAILVVLTLILNVAARLVGAYFKGKRKN